MDVIFDIDSTLANCSHRLHFIQSKPKNWKAFFAGMEYDKPIDATVEVLRCLAMAEDDYGTQHRIIFCTGRPSSHEAMTRQWLVKHIGDWTEDCPLFMRESGDYRPDYEVKQDLLAVMYEHGFDPKIAFEDRDQVVDMWRRNGIMCYQVAAGAY